MNWNALGEIVAMASPPGQTGQNTMPLWAQLFPFLLVFVAFYVALIRPQQKKAKEHEALLKTLRPGDKVITSGGILGIVVGVKEKSVSIRSAETKLEVLKSAVTEIIERNSGGSES